MKLEELEYRIKLFKKYYGGNKMQYETKEKLKYGIIGAIIIYIVHLFLKRNKKSSELMNRLGEKLEKKIDKVLK